MHWYVVLFYSAWALKALYTPAPFTQALFHALCQTFTRWCMYRLTRLFLLWMAFHLKTAIALGPTNQHIRPIDISLEAWYLNSSGDQFRSSLLILSQHALISRQRIPSPASLIPHSLFGKCLSHIPRACVIQSGVEFCMRWETGPRTRRALCAEPYCARLSNSILCRHQMALSFHISVLFYDEWGVRHKMFSGVFIQDCWS